MSASKLKPCPFCGGAAELRRIGNDHTKTRSVTVRCTNIECRIERTDKALRHGHDWLENVAIENWNRRPDTGSHLDSEDAFGVIRELSRISMTLAADLVQAADYTFKGHDYLDRNSVVERVMKWRTEWDATRPARDALAARFRAEGGITKPSGRRKLLMESGMIDVTPADCCEPTKPEGAKS